MTFNTEVVGCFWDEDQGEWRVKLRKQAPGQEPVEFEDQCHLLLYGAGVLNNPKVCPPNCSSLQLRLSSVENVVLQTDLRKRWLWLMLSSVAKHPWAPG
jgi:hypothetical protein